MNKQLIIIAVILAFGLLIPVAVFAENNSCNHVWVSDSSAMKNDDNTHSILYRCILCTDTKTEVEPHDWLMDYTKDPQQIDDEYHETVYKCWKCNARKTEKEEHDFKSTYNYVNIDDKYHGLKYACTVCNATKMDKEEHSLDYCESAKSIDETYHLGIFKCWDCGGTIEKKTEHNYQSDGDYVKLDNDYHGKEYKCEDCGDRTIRDKERHYAEDYERVVKQATLNTKGTVKCTCDECYSSFTKQVSWKRDALYSASYDIVGISAVYSKSKSMTIKLDKAVKGGILKVKVGKKTYTKKLKNNKKKITLKIKKTPYGSKIIPKLYYKGKLIGTNHSDDWNRVLYAKNIRKGMTKKQVKYTYYWGSPDRTATGSGGWSFWYYDDSSWIDFKHGKVKIWYNAV